MIPSSRCRWASSLAIVGLLILCSLRLRSEDFSFFEKKIRPVLAESCFECHSTSSKKVKGGLLLDSREGLLKGGENGPAVVAGKADESLLIKAIRYTDKDLQMPPKDKKLADSVIADFEKWVAMGATYPETPAVLSREEQLVEARKRWPFKKTEAVSPPVVKEGSWPVTDLDRFILAKLEDKSLRPAPPAEKRTLIRRATYDLTGLPPTVEEVEVFLADKSPNAFAKVIDGLLDSPHYGEKWGRHWLDVVRYTDSLDARGIGGEGDISEAYRYRDWVVNAFNSDLPYDQFIMQQIAGDILPGASGSFNTNGLIATGVYVIGEWGTGDADKEKMLTDIIDDQIDVTGRAFLGLTLACARCHDHKFDPILTKDYYGLAGIFFSSHILPNPGVKTAGSPVLRIPMASPDAVAERASLQKKIKEGERRIEELSEEALVRFAKNSISQTARALATVAYYKNKGAGGNLAEVARESSVPEALARAWMEYLGWSDQKLLSKLVRDVSGIRGVDAWKLASADNPSAMINATDQAVAITTLTLPPKSVSVHPSPKAGVGVAWQSPMHGKVSITGSITDSDDKCGDGVDWMIGLRKASGLSEIAKGTIPNGGKSSLDNVSLRSLEVLPGDRLELIVGPKGAYECDTTTVNLHVAELESTKREWDLAKEAVAGERVNPLGDGRGNGEVWSFFDAAGASSGGTDIPEDSILARWRATTNNAERNDLAWNLQCALIDFRDAGGQVSTNDPNYKIFATITNPKGAFWASTRGNLDLLPSGFTSGVKNVRMEVAALKQQLGPAFPVAHGLREGGTPQTPYEGFHDAKVHIRGRYDRLGDVVPRHFPRVVAGDDQPQISEGSGRLQLAKWVASPENPMTARVMVNRIWQHHFGEGIVRTPNNFGKLGTPPTHPELLDYLAVQFVKSGWSVKAMHRMMMLSSTYQQSTVPRPQTFQADPDNLLFGHMNRRRLESEELRDSLLVAGGKLDPSLGGPPIRDLNIFRRTLYVMTVRSDRATYQSLFDAADPVGIVEKRINSTVAPQALFLMNHPFALAQSRALAERAALQSQDERKVLDWLYLNLYSRPPNDREMEIGLAAMGVARKNGPEGASISAAWEPYCQVLLCANEFIYLD
jgi:hypothetical protein